MQKTLKEEKYNGKRTERPDQTQRKLFAVVQ